MSSSSRPAGNEPGSQSIEQRVLPLLESADALVYGLVGVVFLVAAVGMLGYSVVTFPGTLAEQGFPLAIITLINDMLLVMIIMEVLRTVLSYLAERGGSLRPFLFIAAISATRRILAIGASMSITGEQLPPERFQQAMIDLAVNAAVILAIGVALFLIGKRDVSDVESR
ncbi:MAG: hypothetical protein JO057_14435 [Chloroflexi bacterium]|nr:hypothetical protein [Chloroflexota bacterium]